MSGHHIKQIIAAKQPEFEFKKGWGDRHDTRPSKQFLAAGWDIYFSPGDSMNNRIRTPHEYVEYRKGGWVCRPLARIDHKGRMIQYWRIWRQREHYADFYEEEALLSFLKTSSSIGNWNYDMEALKKDDDYPDVLLSIAWEDSTSVCIGHYNGIEYSSSNGDRIGGKVYAWMPLNAANKM